MSLANFTAPITQDAAKVFNGPSRLLLLLPIANGLPKKPSLRAKLPIHGISIGGSLALADQNAVSLGSSTAGNGSSSSATTVVTVSVGPYVARTVNVIEIITEYPVASGQTAQIAVTYETQAGDTAATILDGLYTNLAAALAGTARTNGAAFAKYPTELTSAQISTALQNVFGSTAATAFAKAGGGTTASLTLTAKNANAEWNFVEIRSYVAPAPASALNVISNGVVNELGVLDPGAYRGFQPKFDPVTTDIESDTTRFRFTQYLSGVNPGGQFTFVQDRDIELQSLASGFSLTTVTGQWSQALFGASTKLNRAGLILTMPSSTITGRVDYLWLYDVSFTGGLTLNREKNANAGIAVNFTCNPDNSDADPIGHTGFWRSNSTGL